MDLILDPPRSAGPIVIGMPFDEAVGVLRSLDGYVPPRPGSRTSPGFAHYNSGLSIELGPDTSGRVKAIGVYRPNHDVNVVYQDIPVFGLPADEVMRRLSGLVRLDVEDDGMWVVAPDLLISLVRDSLPLDEDDVNGRYFDSVLVAAPGYYD